MTGNLGLACPRLRVPAGDPFRHRQHGPARDNDRQLGEGGYPAIYSLISLAAFVWLVTAYGAAPVIPVWFPATWMWFVPLAVMPLVFLLLIGGVSTPNPTAVGQEKLLEQELGPRGVLRITRNPVMWGIGLWALAHMVPNGDWASLLFFGTLAVLALLGSVMIDAKNAVRRGDAWTRWTQLSSNIPFVALIQGRQTLGSRSARSAGSAWRWPWCSTPACSMAIAGCSAYPRCRRCECR